MLTDDEIDRITDVQWVANNRKPIYAAHRAYARAIEAAIEAALAAAPQGEPVCFRVEIGGEWFTAGSRNTLERACDDAGVPHAIEPLYLRPPAPAAQPSVADLRDAKWLDPECADRGACQSLRFKVAQPSAESSELARWQGGLTNAELLAAWQSKLPDTPPTDRELSAFALGIEFSTAQGAHRNGKPAQADQGVSGVVATGDRRDERDQDEGCGIGRTGREAAGTGGTGSAVDQHRRDRIAARADGPDAGRGAADVLLTGEAGSRPPHSDELVRAARDALACMREYSSKADEDCGEPGCGECNAMRPTWAALDVLRHALEAGEAKGGGR